MLIVLCHKFGIINVEAESGFTKESQSAHLYARSCCRQDRKARQSEERLNKQTDVAVMGEALGRCWSPSGVCGPSSSSAEGLSMGEGGGALLWAGGPLREDDLLLKEECSREEKSGEGGAG